MKAADFLATAGLLPEPMLLVTRDGDIEAGNGHFATLAGLQVDALAGRSLASLTSDPAAEVAKFLRSCAQSDQMVSGFLTLKGGAGEIRYRCEGVAARESAAAPAQHVLLRLQTGVAHVEDALRRQSETLEVTLRSIGDAVVVTDAQGCVTFLNTVAEKITEWTSEQARGQPLSKVFRILNEYTRQPVEDPVAKVLQTGGVVGLANHTILISRLGREIPVDDSAAPIRRPDGALFGVVLIFRDITEQKKAEHARSWLAAIIESSDDAIVSKTLDGIITSWNRGAARVFGYEADEMIGKPITTIIPPELLAEERAILARVRAGDRIDHFDTVRVGKGGRAVDISLTVSPIRDSHGTIVGASKVARDFTERRRAEQTLRDANRRKDEFLATLAHELRNPLAPVRNATEMLARMQLEPAAHSAAEIIARQVRQMTHLVDDLLDVSRITAGRVRIQKETLDLAGIVAMAVEACRPAIDASNHVLSVRGSAEPLFVQGDRVRLPQIFTNIINNAVKYTEPGGRIDVIIARENDEAVVRIRDTGIGIPPSMLNYIFELFAQVDRSYDRTGGGLGLGLTLARRLVEMHGGKIEAHSAGSRRGSEFVVRLAAVESAAVVPVAPLPVLPKSPARRVLIADDNQDAALSLSMLLEMMGHETRTVHDGLAALKAAEELRPEVVILDIGMPHLDGYATVERLAAQPWASDTLFIALTGWGQENDRKRAMAAGFDHHLVKPVDPDVLSALLG